MTNNKLTLISGPCTAESYELMHETAQFLDSLTSKYPVDFYFKASFDKANRSSIKSYRGPGISQGKEWFAKLKKELSVKVLTDVHECHQVDELKDTCDGLQIPAFLCRQTDLVMRAAASGCFVNIKKGQFISHQATKHIASKVVETCKEHKIKPNFALTERGNIFGYSDLVVDMRGFAQMASYAPAFFDITHSCQKPSSGETTQGARAYASLLARCAAATGYLSGIFMEVHPNPAKAMSDSETQLNFKQAEALLEQFMSVWQQSEKLKSKDSLFG